MWLLTRWPAASADIRESSPASTVAQTTLASCRALSPGHSWQAPCTPSICTHTHTHTHTYIHMNDFRICSIHCDTWATSIYSTGIIHCCIYYSVCVCMYLQAGLLGSQAGASSYGAQLYGGHGAGDVKVFPCWPGRLHQGDAVTAAHWLGRILEDTHTNMLIQETQKYIKKHACDRTSVPVRRLCRWRPPDWLRVRWIHRCCPPLPSPLGSYWCSPPPELLSTFLKPAAHRQAGYDVEPRFDRLCLRHFLHCKDVHALNMKLIQYIQLDPMPRKSLSLSLHSKFLCKGAALLLLHFSGLPALPGIDMGPIPRTWFIQVDQRLISTQTISSIRTRLLYQGRCACLSLFKRGKLRSPKTWFSNSFLTILPLQINSKEEPLLSPPMSRRWSWTHMRNFRP